MKFIVALLFAIIAMSFVAQPSHAQQMSEAGSCAAWYNICLERGGPESLCSSKLRTCRFIDHCWLEANGDRHCGLASGFAPGLDDGVKVIVPHGCPYNLDKVCVKTTSGQLTHCHCAS